MVFIAEYTVLTMGDLEFHLSFVHPPIYHTCVKPLLNLGSSVAQCQGCSSLEVDLVAHTECEGG